MKKIFAMIMCLVMAFSVGALAERGMEAGKRLVLIAGMCGFGGLCLIAQNLGALKGCGVRLAECLGLRAVAAGVSMGYMALFLCLPKLDAGYWLGAIRANPLAAAGLAASLLAVPVVIGLKKSIS